MTHQNPPLRKPPRGPDPWGSGHCPGCGWSYNLHPLDADGVDACRCPVASEDEQIEAMLDKHKRELSVLAHTFPETRPGQHRIRRGRDANGIIRSWMEPFDAT